MSGRQILGARRIVRADRTSVSLNRRDRSTSIERQVRIDVRLVSWVFSILSGLLEECFEIAQDIRALHEDDVPIPLRPVSPVLCSV